MSKEITLIVPVATQTVTDKRESADLHAGILSLGTGKVTRGLNELHENLDACIDNITDLLSDITRKAIENWELEGVTIGLAISAEGSIGIATAGVEASIEISFKPKK